MAKRRSVQALSTAELHREIRRRERTASRQLRRLQRQRDKIAARLSEIDAEITRAGGRVRVGRRGGAPGRRRPRNKTNLVEALAGVLKNATMGVTQVMEAVQRAGYRTNSPNFRTIVNQALLNKGRFKRVSRGKYTAK
jgi:hypothetical protein